MTNLLVLMARRAIAALFPSVPRADRALIAAAMEQPHPETPVPGLRGEAQPGTGRSSGGRGDLDPTPATGHPVDDLLNWRPHPSHRWEFNDRVLAARVDRWKQATS